MNKFIKMYKNMSLPVKASFWYLTCNILQKGISLITVPLFTRILTTSEYGTVSIYNSWSTIINIFATLYLSQGVYNNGMVRYKEDRDSYNLSMQTVTSLLTVSLFLLYLCSSSFWNNLFGLNTPLMIMMFIDIFFSAAMSFWCIRNRYEYKYKPVVLVTFAASFLAPLASILLLNMTQDLRVEAKVLGVSLVHAILYSFIYAINVKKGKKLLNMEHAKYALSFNIPLLPHYLSTTVLNQADRIMINAFVGSSAAGIYSLAYQAGMLMTIVTNSINSSFAPWMYEEMEKKQKDNKYIGKFSMKIIFLVGILCMAVILFAPEVVRILGTDEYLDAIWVIPPVALSVLFIFVYCCFANVEFYFEQKKQILIGSLMSASLNVVLNMLFIPIFGFVAAGYTTLACYVAFAVFHYISMKKVCLKKNFDCPFQGKTILFFCVAFVVCGVLANALYLNDMIRYMVILLIGLAVLIVGYKNMDTIKLIIKKK